MDLKDATILLIDDEPALRDIVGSWFRRVAKDVATAEHGAEALTALATRKFDLIVSDIRMPVMDGVTLLRHAKAGGLRIPAVIFISGFTDIAPREAYDLGVEAMIEKPFERERLISAAKQSLTSRAELWRAPRFPGQFPVLNRVFRGSSAAVQDRRIAFGRGGFCVDLDPLSGEGPVDLRLEFAEDGYILSGQGVVRWVAPEDNLMGIELTSVDEPSLPRAVELAAGASSFIPSSTV